MVIKKFTFFTFYYACAQIFTKKQVNMYITIQLTVKYLNISRLLGIASTIFASI